MARKRRFLSSGSETFVAEEPCQYRVMEDILEENPVIFDDSGSEDEAPKGTLRQSRLFSSETHSIKDVFQGAGATVSMSRYNEMKEKDQKEKEERMNREPIYKGSSICLGTAMLLLATFSQTYNISNEAFDMFLAIISVLLPAGHLIPATFTKYKKYFSLNGNAFYHYYCSFCLG